MYEYIQMKYNNLDLNVKDEFYQSFLNQVDILKNNIELNIDIIPEDVIDKVILQNIDIELNYKDLIETFKKILNEVIKENINKTYIIFYNSNILSLNLESDNYFTFDINSFLDVNDYNILIANEIFNLNYQNLIVYLKDIWPVDYKEREIENLVIEYFRSGILYKNFTTNKEKLYLTALIVNKVYNLNQKITCDRLIFDSIIESFIDNL